jgi:hypothetical protein
LLLLIRKRSRNTRSKTAHASGESIRMARAMLVSADAAQNP